MALDCRQIDNGKWQVYEQETDVSIAEGESVEFAWMNAADSFYRVLDSIKQVVDVGSSEFKLAAE